MDRVPKRVVLSLALAVLSTSACEDRPTGAASTVSDSAGIQIVESFTPVWSAEDAWRVSAEPVVDIGAVEGDPNYQLYRVRWAVRLSDGRVVVANSGSGELRFFDKAGRHLFNVGRKGEGPGEFRFLGPIWPLTGDSLAAFDMGLNRVSVFAPTGEFVRMLHLKENEGMGIPSPEAQLADGSTLVISGTGSWGPDEVGLLEAGTWILSRYGPVGQFLSEIARFPGSPSWRLKGGRTYSSRLPFTNGTPKWAVSPRGLYTGPGYSFEIERRNLQGEIQQLIRRDVARRPIREEERDRYGQYLLAQYQDANRRRRSRQFLSEVPFPDYMPCYSKMLTDALGYLWVENYRAPWERQPRWSVFDPDGRWLGEIETPTGLTVLQIGADYLLGRRRDDLEVEHVTIFGLERG